MKKRLIVLLVICCMITGCTITKKEDENYVLHLWDQNDESIPDVEWEQDDIPDAVYFEPDTEYESEFNNEPIIDTSINPYWERRKSYELFGRERIKLKEVTPLESMWQFCINNTVITMPCSIKDLVDAGCTIVSTDGIKEYSEIVPANCSSCVIDLYTEAPNGEMLYLSAIINNLEDRDCSIYNRTVYSLNVYPFNSESQYRKFNFYVADGAGFDNKYYDAYDYFVEHPSDADYTNFESYPAYTIKDDSGNLVRWEGLNHDDYLISILWVVGNHSEQIVPDEEFEISDSKYSKVELPEYMEFTGLSEGLMFDNEFTLNGVEITLPCSITDLLAAGYLPKGKVASDMEIFANERIDIDFVEVGAPENTFTATVANWGDKSITMSDDCVHIIRFDCKQYYNDDTTVMVKLGNGMTPYVDLGTFKNHYGTDHFIEGESYEFQTVFRIADPPAGFDGTLFDVVEYVFDGEANNSKLMSILIGADIPAGKSY